jgi:hypothetical protein
MTPSSAERPARVDPAIGPSAKHPFNRDPLLIPQLFVGGRPWYRRRAVIVKIVVSVMFVAMIAVVVRHYTVEGVFRRIASLVAPAGRPIPPGAAAAARRR